MRRFLVLVLFVAGLLWLPRVVKSMTEGFRPCKLAIDLPFYPEWEISMDPSVEQILSQPFRYLAQGGQSFVFESEDGDYILKFFRFDRRLFPKLGSLCSRKKKSKTPRLTKAVTVLNASQIAYDRLREETGLVYLHLNETPLGIPPVCCRNAIGRPYFLNLDRCRFAVQKKAVLFADAFKTAVDNPEKMQQRIDQFMNLVLSRTEKGVFNTDPTLIGNFGFLDDRAIELDFGNYRPVGAHSRHAEVMRYMTPFRTWLSSEAPEWVEYVDLRLRRID